MEYVTDYARGVMQDVMEVALRMGPKQWFLALVAVLIAGALCMRGFGSRSSY